MGFNVRHRFSGGTAVGMGSGNELHKFGRFAVSQQFPAQTQSFAPQASPKSVTKRDATTVQQNQNDGSWMTVGRIPEGSTPFSLNDDGSVSGWRYPDGVIHNFKPDGSEITPPATTTPTGTTPAGTGGAGPSTTARPTALVPPHQLVSPTVVEGPFHSGDVHLAAPLPGQPTTNNVLDPGAFNGAPPPAPIPGFDAMGPPAPGSGFDPITAQQNLNSNVYGAAPGVGTGGTGGSNYIDPGNVTDEYIGPPAPTGPGTPPVTTTSPTLSGPPVDLSLLDPGIVDPLSGTPMASGGGNTLV